MNELQGFDRMPLTEVRERIIEQLQLHYAHDNLREDEFETRLDRAQDAQTKQELAALVADLPVLSDTHQSSSEQGALRINNGPVRPSSNIVSILGGATRKGLWRPARQSTVLSVLGGIDLNYCEAELPPGETVVEAFCLLGSVDITVPEGLAVEVEAVPILGSVNNRVAESYDATSPVLRVRGLTVLGSVNIKLESKRKRERRKRRRLSDS